MKGKWTRAGVRHHDERWYWVQEDGRAPVPAPFQGGVYTITNVEQYGGQSWRRWSDLALEGWRRWSEPIEVPK